MISGISLGSTGLPAIATILSPDCSPTAAAGVSGDDAVHGGRRLAAAGHVERREQHDGEQEVRTGACEDDRDALPGSGAPVRIRPEGVADVRQAPLGRGTGGDGELCALDLLAELVQRGPGAVVVAHRQLAPQRLRRGREGRLLRDRPSEVHVEVARRRAVHAGDLHVAAERDGADAVLDPVTAPFRERRREADVELARVHADPARREEVAGLVDQDQDMPRPRIATKMLM